MCRHLVMCQLLGGQPGCRLHPSFVRNLCISAESNPNPDTKDPDGLMCSRMVVHVSHSWTGLLCATSDYNL